MPLIQVTDDIRIEDSPLRLRAVATKELLSDEVTAKHYQEGAPDALGKSIVLGEEMDYIDFRNRARMWNLYREQDVPDIDKDGNKTTRRCYVKISAHESQEAAIAAAAALAVAASKEG